MRSLRAHVLTHHIDVAAPPPHQRSISHAEHDKLPQDTRHPAQPVHNLGGHGMCPMPHNTPTAKVRHARAGTRCRPARRRPRHLSAMKNQQRRRRTAASRARTAAHVADGRRWRRPRRCALRQKVARAAAVVAVARPRFSLSILVTAIAPSTVAAGVAAVALVRGVAASAMAHVTATLIHDRPVVGQPSATVSVAVPTNEHQQASPAEQSRAEQSSGGRQVVTQSAATATHIETAEILAWLRGC
jgi:hypothetical protein